MSNHSPRGVLNLGESCYLSAVLQMLAHSPGLVRAIEQQLQAAATDAAQQPAGWCTVVAELSRGDAGNSGRGPLNPWAALAALGRAGQQDAHEVLTEMLSLSACEGASQAAPISPSHRHPRAPPGTLERARPPPPHTLTPLTPTMTLRALAHAMDERWSGELPRSPSLAEALHGQMLVMLTCSGCKAESLSDDLFSVLPLAVSRGSIGECLRAHLAQHSCPDWRCGACGVAGAGRRAEVVWRPPRTLVLMLKRYTARGRALREPVALDPVLNLNGVCLRTRDARFTYNLTAVVSHAGGTPMSGHYTAACVTPRGDWWVMNDSNVAPLVGGLASIDSREVYMLSYDARCTGQ